MTVLKVIGIDVVICKKWKCQDEVTEPKCEYCSRCKEKALLQLIGVVNSVFNLDTDYEAMPSDNITVGQ